MLSGVMSGDNLTNTLRDISQRRRQGVLEVTVAERQWRLSFVQGRIVDFEEVNRNSYREVFDIFKRIGVLPQAVPLSAEVGSYRDLFQFINENSPVEEDFFRQAIKHRILNGLYEVTGLSGGMYSFQVRMVDYDREFLPSISVGQLLLDLVALQADRARVTELFPPGTLIELTPGLERAYSEEEEMIAEVLVEPVEIDMLASRTILSSYHLWDALLAMHDGGAVRRADAPPTTAQAASQGTADFSMEDIARSLEASIDESFSAALSDPLVESGAAGVASDANAATSRIAAETIRPSLKGRLNLVNMGLLQSNLIVNTVVAVLFLAALLCPFYFWQEMFAGF